MTNYTLPNAINELSWTFRTLDEHYTYSIQLYIFLPLPYPRSKGGYFLRKGLQRSTVSCQPSLEQRLARDRFYSPFLTNLPQIPIESREIYLTHGNPFTIYILMLKESIRIKCIPLELENFIVPIIEVILIGFVLSRI